MAISIDVVAYSGLLGGFCYFLFVLLQVGKRDPHMPNGPRTIPILGNALQIPTTGLGKQLGVWARKYGPVYSLKVISSSIVVLCDRKSVHDLLDKKGAIYSDRPYNYVGEVITQGDHLTFEAQGPSWKEKRSVTTAYFSPKKLDTNHWQIQEAEAVVFMNNIMQKPDLLLDFAKLYTCSVATTLLWGHRAASLDCFWNKDLNVLMERWTTAMEPGANPPVEEFPFLKYLPGLWKNRAYECRDTMNVLWSKARDVVDERRARGDKRECLIDAKLDEYNMKGWPMSEHAFNNLFGELVEAGADTTANQILTLIFVFAKYPAIQKKAQAQIDVVCGTERAPLFSDFNDIPYINAIVKEGMRWRPTSHTGLPHMNTKDDVYEGKLIPKGTTVFLGIWAMHHDENIYPNHDQFDPDRFLNHPKLANEYAVSADYENRDHYGYGAGRRMCPGIHLAERNMWRIASKLLWAFDFAEPIDPVTGKVMPLDIDAFTSGILTCPLPFKVRVTPRSEKHVATIQRELKGSLDLLSAFE